MHRFFISAFEVAYCRCPFSGRIRPCNLVEWVVPLHTQDFTPPISSVRMMTAVFSHRLADRFVCSNCPFPNRNLSSCSRSVSSLVTLPQFSYSSAGFDNAQVICASADTVGTPASFLRVFPCILRAKFGPILSSSAAASSSQTC